MGKFGKNIKKSGMSTIKKIYKDSGILLQTANNSCGACAVGNLNMLYTGEQLSEDELLQEYVQTLPFPVGCENEDVISGVLKLGYTLSQEKVGASLGDIESELLLGNRVIVNYYNPFQDVGHYAVVEDFDEHYFYLYDSIFGIYRLNTVAFEKVWHNFSHTVERWFVSVTRK